jgi:hypothetical protein
MLKRPSMIALVVGVLLLARPPRLAADAVIAVGPFTPSATPFVVPIQVTGAVQLLSWQFDLAFDPTQVQINTLCDSTTDPFCDPLFGPVTEGPFFAGVAQFPTLFVPGFIVNDQGLLLGVAGFWQDPPPGPSGDGVLAYVEFIGIGTGDPNIRVENPFVTFSPIPEPAPLLLLASGLALLGAQRLTRRWRREKG